MGLFSRSPDVAVDVSPAAATPRQTVSATVVAGRPIDRVRAATLEWGYTNFYRYHWAGRSDSALARGGDWAYPAVGTGAGGDRDTDDWVSITAIDLPVHDAEFVGAASSFRVPSWAPASSPELVRWSCRVVVERGGRDVDVHSEFAVRVGVDDVAADPGGTEPVMGDRETVLEIELDTPVVAAGGTIHGHVRLTPTRDLPDGDIGVCWRKCRESHPLTRTPTRGGELDGPIVGLGRDIPLRAGMPLSLPFGIALPADAPPSAAAVHSSMKWFVQARLFYAGFIAPTPERVLRPLVVVSGP